MYKSNLFLIFFLATPFLFSQEQEKETTSLKDLFKSNAYQMEMPYDGTVVQESTVVQEARSAGILTGASLQDSLEVHAFVQVFFVASDETTDQFKLRRAELSFKGALTDTLDFFVMIDPAKSISENKTVSGTAVKQFKKDGSILQDLGLNFKVLGHKLVVGQFKRPISLEGLQSSGALELLERATVVQVLGDKRDIGAMVQGEYKTFKLQYMVGVFNGEGSNSSDANDRKDVAGMLIFKPLEGMMFYVSGWEGTQGGLNDTQQRIGTGGRVESGPFVLRFEYLTAQDAKVDRDGWYVLGAYRLNNWGVEALKPLRLALRYEQWDADRSDDAEIHTWTAGAQYFLDEKETAKLAADVFYADGKGQEKDDVGVTLGVQAKF